MKKVTANNLTDPSAPLTACPFTKIREYPGCFEDCPDTSVCPRKGVTVPAPTKPLPGGCPF